MPLEDYFSLIKDGVTLDHLRDSNALIVISPHPDDDVIGVGGCMANTVSSRRVVSIYMTDGSGSIRQDDPEQIATVRKKEACDALKCLHCDGAFFLNAKSSSLFSSNLHEYTNARKTLRSIFLWIKPQEIYTTAPYEIHITHLGATEMVIDILREIFGELPTQLRLWGYPIWGPLLGERSKLRYQSIDEYVDIKRQSVLAHKGEVEYKPYHDGIIQRDRFQAVFNDPHHRCISDYAELFLDMTELIQRTNTSLQDFASEQAQEYIRSIYMRSIELARKEG